MGLKSFEWFSDLWISGTRSLSLAQRGAYVDLLSFQNQLGSLPENPLELARIISATKEEFLPLWNGYEEDGISYPPLKDKFENITILLKDISNTVNSGLVSKHKRIGYKGIKNGIQKSVSKQKISGTFAGLLKRRELDEELTILLKSDFKTDMFTGLTFNELKEVMERWFDERLEYYKSLHPGAKKSDQPDLLTITDSVEASVEARLPILYNKEINRIGDKNRDSILKYFYKNKLERKSFSNDQWEVALKWLEYKYEKKQSYSERGISALFRNLASYPVQIVDHAIQIAIDNEYKGYFIKPGTKLNSERRINEPKRGEEFGEL